MERQPFTVRLRPDLIKELKHHAVDEGRRMYAVIEEAMEKYLNEHSKYGGTRSGDTGL